MVKCILGLELTWSLDLNLGENCVRLMASEILSLSQEKTGWAHPADVLWCISDRCPHHLCGYILLQGVFLPRQSVTGIDLPHGQLLTNPKIGLKSVACSCHEHSHR